MMCKRQESACLWVLDPGVEDLDALSADVPYLIWACGGCVCYSAFGVCFGLMGFTVFETFLNSNLKTKPKVDMAKHG